MNKIDINKPGTSLFVSGLGGTSKFDVGTNAIVPSLRMEGPRTVQIKVLDTVPEQILIQEASSNNLIQANNQLVVG